MAASRRLLAYFPQSCPPTDDTPLPEPAPLRLDDLYRAPRRTGPVRSHERMCDGTVREVTSFGIFVSVEGLQLGGAFADVVGMHHGADGSTVIWPEVGDSVTGVVVEHTERNHQLKVHLR